MAAKPPTGRLASQEPQTRVKDAVLKRMAQAASQITTEAISEIERSHPWFGELNAADRSWITIVARAGIDGFLSWLRHPQDAAGPKAVFAAAPAELRRHVTLHQTVEMVRTTIDTVDGAIERIVPRGDRLAMHIAILQFSRELAFAAAAVYAKAAESRGAWDARLEAMVVDSVIRGEADEAAVSQAATLGWPSPRGIAVVIGATPGSPTQALEEMRPVAATHGWTFIGAPQGDRLVLVLGGDFEADHEILTGVRALANHFGDGPVVVGPVVTRLEDAVASARAALSGMRSVAGWPGAPRPVAATDLLPERALGGDGHARRTLAHDIYAPLLAAGGDLLETLVGFCDNGGSVEATARTLFVHPNTVRYRIKRIQEITGLLPTDPRDVYVLRMALTLGRLLG